MWSLAHRGFDEHEGKKETFFQLISWKNARCIHADCTDFFDKSCSLMHVHLLHKCIFKKVLPLGVHLSNVFNLLLHKAALFNNQSHHAKQSQNNIKESNIKLGHQQKVGIWPSYRYGRF